VILTSTRIQTKLLVSTATAPRTTKHDTSKMGYEGMQKHTTLPSQIKKLCLKDSLQKKEKEKVKDV